MFFAMRLCSIIIMTKNLYGFEQLYLMRIIFLFYGFIAILVYAYLCMLFKNMVIKAL